MRRGRLIALACAALAAGGVALGAARPRGERASAASAPPPPAASPEPAAPAEPPWPPPAVRAVKAQAPADVRLEVTPLAGGGASIRVSRPGHLVALQHRGASSAGRDWAGLELRVMPGKQAPERDALIWEATDLGRLTTVRGLVQIEGGAARLALAEPPRRGPALADAGGAHECASHEDGSGGFTVICRLGRGARAARAVNLTGGRPLEGAWIVDAGRGQGAVARLELPRGAAFAEARALTYVRGLSGVVLRAEAMWPPGEESTLRLAEARRAQPSADAVWR